MPPGVAAVIERAVSLEAERRPSASELAELLAHADLDPAPAPVRAPLGAAAIAWRKWAIAGGAALALILIAVLATRGPSSSRASPPAAPAAAAGPEEASDYAEVPSQIDATPPPNLNGRSARDWNHIVEELERGHFEGARHKLDEFERRWGGTPETQHLRDQLERLPPDLERDHRRPGPED
jgi:hypothetical protein